MLDPKWLFAALGLLLGPLQEPQQPTEEPLVGPAIEGNPYFEHTEWRVWRDDESPLEGVSSMKRVEKQEQHVTVTLAPIATAERLYPTDPPAVGSELPFVKFELLPGGSKTYAGMWDDVYSSWSGLHGYVRPNWRGSDGSKVNVLDQIMHFVDGKKADMRRAGVNFVHQSTTSMGHTITNGYFPEMTSDYEELYFADCLVTSPAHASFTDLDDAGTSDLYIALVPTLFNSVGSSNSETMAITKMIIVGAYLPPATKLLLKRNGLYPAALLSIWKAALPYDVPYDHELRHRIAYKSVGDRNAYPEKYSAAGINRGDKSLAFHQYDDLAHMRNMIGLARSMDVAPPEAIFEVESTGAGELRYALKKAAVVIQEAGQDVELEVSTAGCYDLQGLPVEVRWKLLYGNKQTTVEPHPEDPSRFTVRVPWDAALPEGRTALALVANNGRFDSNPAILTVYRKQSPLPPNGVGPKDYGFPLTFANKRPILLDAQDQVVRPGKRLELELRTIDPEGFPVSFYKRSGEIGTIDGNVFSWACPRKEPDGERTVTLIASDGTSGNSYAGKTLTIHIGKPAQMAHITAEKLSGPAPLKLHFSAKESLGRTSKTDFGWDFERGAEAAKPKPFEQLAQGRDQVHSFEEPGLYTVELTMRNDDEATEGDLTSVRVWVTEKKSKGIKASLQVEGNGVLIRDGDDSPSAFDHTAFGALAVKHERVHRFRLSNPGTEPLRLGARLPVKLTGPDAGAFGIVHMPRKQLEGGASSLLEIAFAPRRPGSYSAQVVVGMGSSRVSFTISAEATP